MQTVLITGGAGFIGSYLVDACIARHYRVLILDDLSTGKRTHIHKQALLFQKDIRWNDIEEIFQAHDIDTVFHLAGQKNVRFSVDNPHIDADINILGSLNILQMCVQYGVRKCIFASTGGVMYGDAKIIPTPESYPPQPISPYALSKLTAEHYLDFFRQTHGLQTLSLRFANVYGPRQDPGGESGVVAIFSQKIIKDEQPVIYGAGHQTRDYMFVSDAIDAFLLAYDSQYTGCYNVGTGKETSLLEIIQYLSRVAGVSITPKHTAGILGDQLRSALDCTRIQSDLGWKPRVSLEEGIHRTFSWFLSEVR
ncbi:MAG: hypothetical protein A3B74_03015 [Candidatus Kerfeldbacteria bacterium RIFCSPHIGHO2_02_FULL_42_14]|uniref:NAD-dependent epimerase/dehydratase domain-containing protein n=1 Tax=Candidatus Kerfeldbacteria bacterium RIFCSPHIGHO2_02_FULL_42_14 TaxID=1798540 RepID=A0A1G2ARW9_9BACT|nr:MAG: hypothetical protein A3B74_03015 [Candidatus Kerfeldbacteria bacterium RIFCSPHIGHO2_02_FULL_42_14]OGY80515.1 MAG: hypothetical protein A3E60_03905 [Candidatus Kerfeldbacteria bacterium RIFCSPHIGHO2_12_FULL_42_13]OGY84114.1 MAG: hypothetical protein A3I91_01325 [Candidatus Kerfeldbacteria bacterium RIFCSPLOWO2_02_FULL_42_19]OGY87244.1 MAG: hypothetical protein A3G01_02795 [Candidatus Kerfeldbacteria bacterium RIFCSPLOWO2_12_FULL_43_9]